MYVAGEKSLAPKKKAKAKKQEENDIQKENNSNESIK
jgi:hypothetical protein